MTKVSPSAASPGLRRSLPYSERAEIVTPSFEGSERTMPLARLLVSQAATTPARVAGLAVARKV
jgi:hypothetical protein